MNCKLQLNRMVEIIDEECIDQFLKCTRENCLEKRYKHRTGSRGVLT